MNLNIPSKYPSAGFHAHPRPPLRSPRFHRHTFQTHLGLPVFCGQPVAGGLAPRQVHLSLRDQSDHSGPGADGLAGAARAAAGRHGTAAGAAGGLQCFQSGGRDAGEDLGVHAAGCMLEKH